VHLPPQAISGSLFGRPRLRKRARIEIIPMIDTIFFLLVFFMIFSLSLSRQAGIGIEAPEGGAPLPRAPEVVVAIPFEGSLLVDGVQVTEGDLGATLEQALRAHPDAVAVIAADRNVKHGRVVQVMETARAAGAKRLAIGTVQGTSGQ